MQLKDILQKTTQFLRDKGSPSARLDTELLISTALKWDRVKLYLNYEYPLSEAELNTAREYVRRRAAGEPVAYILETKDFYNHAFKVNRSVLIPRPETEALVEAAIEYAGLAFVPVGELTEEPANETSDAQVTDVSVESEIEAEVEADAGPAPTDIVETPSIRVIDLGTGSGCVGLSVLSEVPGSVLLAVDLSPPAIEVASENAVKLELSDRAHFLTQDAGALTRDQVEEVLGGPADIVLANPPYIDEADPQVEKNVRRYEPQGALFSADQGLSHIREWAEVAGRIARPGALVMFEMGHEQARAVTSIFEKTGLYDEIKVVKDLSGRERFIRALVAGSNKLN